MSLLFKKIKLCGASCSMKLQKLFIRTRRATLLSTPTTGTSAHLHVCVQERARTLGKHHGTEPRPQSWWPVTVLSHSAYQSSSELTSAVTITSASVAEKGWSWPPAIPQWDVLYIHGAPNTADVMVPDSGEPRAPTTAQGRTAHLSGHRNRLPFEFKS